MHGSAELVEDPAVATDAVRLQEALHAMEQAQSRSMSYTQGGRNSKPRASDGKDTLGNALPATNPGGLSLSVLSTCVTKQTRRHALQRRWSPGGSRALVLRTMMRYALERESHRGSTLAVSVELPKEEPNKRSDSRHSRWDLQAGQIIRFCNIDSGWNPHPNSRSAEMSASRHVTPGDAMKLCFASAKLFPGAENPRT